MGAVWSHAAWSADVLISIGPTAYLAKNPLRCSCSGALIRKEESRSSRPSPFSYPVVRAGRERSRQGRGGLLIRRPRIESLNDADPFLAVSPAGLPARLALRLLGLLLLLGWFLWLGTGQHVRGDPGVGLGLSAGSHRRFVNGGLDTLCEFLGILFSQGRAPILRRVTGANTCRAGLRTSGKNVVG